MPNPSLKKYLSGFKSIRGVLVAVGILLPGYAYFTKYAPPFFSGITLLTAAFATAIIFITYYYNVPQESDSQQGLPPMIKKAVKVLIASFILLVLYLVLLDSCTVLIPGTDARVQIGFGKLDWSLTDYGKQIKYSDSIASTQQWLNDEGFRKDVAKIFWKTWSIYASGILMIFVFMFAFVLWTFGWSLIAKQRALDAN